MSSSWLSACTVAARVASLPWGVPRLGATMSCREDVLIAGEGLDRSRPGEPVPGRIGHVTLSAEPRTVDDPGEPVETVLGMAGVVGKMVLAAAGFTDINLAGLSEPMWFGASSDTVAMRASHPTPAEATTIGKPALWSAACTAAETGR